MTPPLTPRLDRPLEPTAAETTSTQLFGVLYITLTGLVDSVVPNSGPWSLLGQSLSYIIKLAPILWWALPAGLTAPHPEPPNASTYDWLPDRDDVRNDNLDATKSQNTEPESNPGQNPLQTTRLIGWEHGNPLLIKKVATSLPGPKPLAVPQDSASKPPVQDAKNSP
ncbi:hypothetical protein DSO57_1031028 [Entomophthora muscae]|uniref:Uncharacterized protein n=1 Tax=Entomophthora muscae TaxID=34485 RepID=A0ACC2RFG4_9FUNG|nr:hypothetical protein DSO57_1031028 [Entomophthora muscae]